MTARAWPAALLVTLVLGFVPSAEAQGISPAAPNLARTALPSAERPFGTLREQAALQQAWLKKRLDTSLPALMRWHGIDFWVVPTREYNEDPVFSSITAPETFFARRRTIYVPARCTPTPSACTATARARSSDCGTTRRASLGG